MVAEDCCHITANIFMARRLSKLNLLRILLSEFDEGLKEPSLGIKERSCVIGMFVIIMGAEHD